MSAVTKVAQVSRLDAPRAAREQARSFFVGRVPTTALDDVQLVVSELVTNAMVHGDGAIVLHLAVEPDHIVVAVADEGDGRPFVRALQGDALGGRGLAMVSLLARAWGVRPQPGGGKVVWCALSVSG